MVTYSCTATVYSPSKMQKAHYVGRERMSFLFVGQPQRVKFLHFKFFRTFLDLAHLHHKPTNNYFKIKINYVDKFLKIILKNVNIIKNHSYICIEVQRRAS